MLGRRSALWGVGSALAFPAYGQEMFPDRPVRIVIGFAAGGPTDIVMRRIAERMSAILGRPIIVENKTGATGTIAATEVARSRPDGYTLLVAVSSSHAIAANTMARPGFHPVDDCAGIGILCIVPIAVGVNPNVPARSLAELVALARSQPGSLSFATSGIGGIAHLSGELFLRQAGGLRMNHVPYRGAAQSLQDVVAGHVPVYMDSIGNAVEAHQAGRIRLLAQFTDRRVSILPDVPTAIESGVPDMLAYTYNALLAPAGTPADRIGTLHNALRRALAEPEIIEFLRTMAATPVSSTPESTLNFVRAEFEKWRPLIRDLGLAAQ